MTDQLPSAVPPAGADSGRDETRPPAKIPGAILLDDGGRPVVDSGGRPVPAVGPSSDEVEQAAQESAGQAATEVATDEQLAGE